MKLNYLLPRLIALFIAFWLISPAIFATENQALSDAEAKSLAIDAYIYGYPLVTMDMTRAVMTNVKEASDGRGPMGQFVNMRSYPNAFYRDVTAPNADTLYSAAWLDLSKEPYILHVPDEDNRYYLMAILSGWTNVFSVPGTRTTGTKEHNFIIIGPNWQGKLPKGFTKIQAPTNLVWILGRTYCTGTREDYIAVHQLQDQYKVTSLSNFGHYHTPEQSNVDPDIDMRTPVRDQVNALNAEIFFKKLAHLMQDNPPATSDKPMVASLAKLGIVAGQDFNFATLDPVIRNALNAAVKAGQEKILNQSHDEKNKNGWEFTLKTGLYGTDYLQRAFITAVGLGANRPQDAIYSTAKVDGNGDKLHGKNHYILHFDKGALPPVKAFWSLTLYDNDYFFIQNPLNKYAVSQRDNLVANEDGSIDIYIQHYSPGKEKQANWLPAPPGHFMLMFRFYWPKDAIISGKWEPPGIKKI